MTTDYAGQLHDWMSIYGPDEQLADLNALIADRDAWRAIAERQTRHTDAAVLMVSKLEAERDEALREHDAAVAEANRYDTGMAVLEASTTKIGDEWVEEYRWKTGAYHKILGFRPKIMALAGEFRQLRHRAEAAEARVTELEAALGFYADKKHIVRQGDNGLYILCDFGDEARIALAKEDADE